MSVHSCCAPQIRSRLQVGLKSYHTLDVQARELKSVQLDAPAGAVRLLLHAPHANRYNTSAQVLTAASQRCLPCPPARCTAFGCIRCGAAVVASHQGLP
jgi:hypothetical protein